MPKQIAFVKENPRKVNSNQNHEDFGLAPDLDSDPRYGIYLKGGAVLLDATEFVFDSAEYLISQEFRADWFEY